MRYLPVHWSEGMFLLPQHFQAADQHWLELIRCSSAYDHAYNYGLSHVDLSNEAIGNGAFHLHSCGARFQEGTLVALEPGQAPDRKALRQPTAEAAERPPTLQKSLAEALAAEATLLVYLAIPKLKPGDRNVAPAMLGSAGVGPEAAGGAACRFREVLRPQFDESAGGGEAQEISLKSPNVQLRLSTEDLAGYELLPVARIKRAGQAGPELDTDYIPPVLAVDAWQPLAKLMLYIYDRIGQTIQVLSEHVRVRRISFVEQDPAEVDRLMRLSYLCEAHGELGPVVFGRGLHPFTAYRELCRVVCRLALLSEERRPPPFAALPPTEQPPQAIDFIPYYDHDRIGEIFRWFKAKIESLLSVSGPKGRFEQRPFEGVFSGMQVALDREWFYPGWTWYVGVVHKNISSQESNEFFTPNQLHWKMASASQVDTHFRNGVPALALKPLAHPPSLLPLRADCTYYEVSREPPVIWADVVASQTLAIRFRDALIVNRETLKGGRTLVLNCGGKNAELDFILFAVSGV